MLALVTMSAAVAEADETRVAATAAMIAVLTMCFPFAYLKQFSPVRSFPGANPCLNA
jgi:hypothetical protein